MPEGVPAWVVCATQVNLSTEVLFQHVCQPVKNLVGWLVDAIETKQVERLIEGELVCVIVIDVINVHVNLVRVCSHADEGKVVEDITVVHVIVHIDCLGDYNALMDEWHQEFSKTADTGEFARVLGVMPSPVPLIGEGDVPLYEISIQSITTSPKRQTWNTLSDSSASQFSGYSSVSSEMSSRSMRYWIAHVIICGVIV